MTSQATYIPPAPMAVRGTTTRRGTEPGRLGRDVVGVGTVSAGAAAVAVRIRTVLLISCLVISALFLSSCGKPVHDFNARKLSFVPRPGVTVHAVLKDVVDRSEVVRGMTFLRFQYELVNDSPLPVYLDIARVRVRLEREASMDSWYDSEAEHVRGWDTINVGQRRSYDLYTVFTTPLNLSQDPPVEVTDPGLK